jgi:hypothetical protein
MVLNGGIRLFTRRAELSPRGITEALAGDPEPFGQEASAGYPAYSGDGIAPRYLTV